jgi:hypothetical protein
MRTVYVLMYWSDEDGVMDVPTREKSPPKLRPYAVFEDSITAEKMKRTGDEIVKVPFFEDRSDRSNTYVSPKSISLAPCNDHTTVTYQSSPWSKDSTLAPPDYEPFPRVTCNKTIDEHTWRNRVD